MSIKLVERKAVSRGQLHFTPMARFIRAIAGTNYNRCTMIQGLRLIRREAAKAFIERHFSFSRLSANETSRQISGSSSHLRVDVPKK
jgi:hypothetical protein